MPVNSSPSGSAGQSDPLLVDLDPCRGRSGGNVVIKIRRDDPQWSDRCCDPNKRSMRRVRYRAFTEYQIAGVSMCVEVGGHRPEERVEVPLFVERHSCDARQIAGKLLEGRQARGRIHRGTSSDEEHQPPSRLCVDDSLRQFDLTRDPHRCLAPPQILTSTLHAAPYPLRRRSANSSPSPSSLPTSLVPTSGHAAMGVCPCSVRDPSTDTRGGCVDLAKTRASSFRSGFVYRDSLSRR